ncbi:MAG: ribosomal protein L7/L12 [Verrucomicrobiota bacterium]
MNAQLNATQLAVVRDTVRAGNKIEAIKLYREYTGAGLAEAKEAVEKIEAGQPVESISPAGMPASILPERRAWIEEALFKGEKIEAIKLYRDGTNLGLKESKEAVEKIEAVLRQQSPEKFTAKAGKGCLVMMVGLGGLLLAVVLVVVRFS